MRLFLAAALAIAAASPAAAAINAPVPANAFISFGGRDWAWANPCAPGPGYGNGQTCGAIDLSYQGTQGWRVALAADFANAPAPADFLVPGGNQDGNFACAAPWFGTVFTRCDYGDGTIGAIFNLPGSQYVGNPNIETWVVRDGSGGAVPEPAAWTMLIAGFGLVGAAMRRRKAALAA
ncbi:PEPxxWA-CTERM sorting domain-containing protein [Sandarakinorhabdus sp.]|uniref:PEPxxWA-CTERM sorting domain-containing protein n=1 Tax=Sandarakinorhabdus sp. TaxID=1916663 RepID=UPI00286E0012|nr:PEPxxWA-CTERM sorting domain-containing protein [Sandarakinorhabdus sp.]